MLCIEFGAGVLNLFHFIERLSNQLRHEQSIKRGLPVPDGVHAHCTIEVRTEQVSFEKLKANLSKANTRRDERIALTETLERNTSGASAP